MIAVEFEDNIDDELIDFAIRLLTSNKNVNCLKFGDYGACFQYISDKNRKIVSFQNIDEVSCSKMTEFFSTVENIGEIQMVPCDENVLHAIATHSPALSKLTLNNGNTLYFNGLSHLLGKCMGLANLTIYLCQLSTEALTAAFVNTKHSLASIYFGYMPNVDAELICNMLLANKTIKNVTVRGCNLVQNNKPTHAMFKQFIKKHKLTVVVNIVF